MRLHTATGVALVVAMTTGATAFAQTKTAQFGVRAAVVADCTVTAIDLNLGKYVSTTSTRINLQCTNGAPATVALDGGGTDHPQAKVVTSVTNTGKTVVSAVRRHVPEVQSLASGSYDDAIKVTVSF